MKGATLYNIHSEDESEISIHAPVKGATRFSKDMYTLYDISIHAPVKGATGPLCGTSVRRYHFNPRSREGSDSLLMVGSGIF